MIKKVLLLTFSLICTISITAQDEAENIDSENDIILGGNMNFNYQDNFNPLFSQSFFPGDLISFGSTDINFTTFGINPYIGKQLNNNWTLGAVVGYRYNQVSQETSSGLPPQVIDHEFKSNQLSLGIFSRYFFNPTKLVNFYIQPEVQYIYEKGKEFEDDNIEEEVTSSAFAADIGLGILYNINSNIRITGNVGALSFMTGNTSYENVEEENDFTDFGLDFSPSSIFFGVEFTL